MERALFILFLTFRSHQDVENSQSRERHMCARQMSFSAIFVFNKIMVSIFQIIHIRNMTLDPCINGGLEQRRKVQTCPQGLFTFSH